MKINRTHTDYWEHFPIQTVRDNVIVSKAGDLTLGWEITLPEMGTLDRESIEQINEKFTEAIKLLPPWMVVHRQDVYLKERYEPETDTTSYLGRSYQEHFRGREYLRHRQMLFLTLSSRSSALRPSSYSGMYLIPHPKKGEMEGQVLSLKSKALPFISKLTESQELKARELEDEDIIAYLESYRRLFDPDRIPTDLETLPGCVIMDDTCVWSYSISESKDLSRMLYSSRPVEKYSNRKYKTYSSAAAAIGPLLDCEHIVNTCYMVLEKDSTMSEIDSRKRRMASMSKRSIENRNNSNELEEFQNAVHQDDSAVISAHMDILIWGRKEQKASLVSLVSSALSSMSINAVMNTLDTPVVWYAGMPGACCELGKDHFMKMELTGAMSLNINETFSRSIDGGVISLCDRIRKIPLHLDIQAAARKAGYIDNYNAFILGESGAGKSFFTNLMARCSYDKGESVSIIDIGGSYKGLCSVIFEESDGKDGHYHDWDRDNMISFDAFWDFGEWTDSAGNLNPDSDGLTFVQSLIKILWHPRTGWDSNSSAVLMGILRDFSVRWPQEKGKPVFDDLMEFIKHDIYPQLTGDSGYICNDMPVYMRDFDVQKLLMSCSDYMRNGIYGFLLNNPEPPDLLSSRFTVFEVSKLTDGTDSYSVIYQVVVLCIMNALNTKMKGTQGHKMMIIEEAWKAIANEVMSGFLTGMWKTSRKYETSAIVVTQQISDIMSSDTIKDTIIQNSSTKILLKQSSNQSNIDDIGVLLGLNPHEKAMIATMSQNTGAHYKEVFITQGGKHSGVYTTEVSPQEAIAFESQMGTKRPFLELAQRVGYVEAIREMTRS